MTITADSFAGRVLAVLSRRSPGLRPPLEIAQDDKTKLRLADATAHWTSVSAQERLRRRSDLLSVVRCLKTANDLALGRGHQIRSVLDQVNKLARDLDEGDIVAGLGRQDHLAKELDFSLRRVRDLADDLASAQHFARDLDLGLALDHARDLVVDLADDLGLARTLVRGLEPALPRARGRVRPLARPLDRARTRAFALARDLAEAHDNLTYAANSFVGADLTSMDPAEVDRTRIAWIRWDTNTRWPTSELADRMHGASLEAPPGSGVFVVQPADGHSFADVGFPVPMP